MTQGNAKRARSKRADSESSHGLVGDLLRRATSPEVLAGVAGAAAAARFTKHAVEQSEDEPETPTERQEDGASARTDGEAPEDEAAEVQEDEPDEDQEGEPADDRPQDEDEAEEEADAETEDEPDEGGEEDEDETAEDRAPSTNGSLAEDDDRMQLLARARGYAEQLTGHPVESFSGLAQEKRGWRVSMEVVEVSRVPSTTDVLACYEVILTAKGELVDFRRAGRYYRNATDGSSS